MTSYSSLASTARLSSRRISSPPVWIPQELSLDAYTAMFGGIGQGGIPVLEYFRNSLIISITSTVIAVAIGMAGGYAFARYRFRGKSALFLGLMLTRTVPGIALSLPLFIVYCAHRHHRHAFRADPRSMSRSTCRSRSG